MAAKQARIVAAAARLVRPGGRLVYATCSLLDAENRAVVEGFLAAHPDFSLESAPALLRAQGVPTDAPLGDGDYLELWPHRSGTDGFFAAAMTRRKPEPPVADALEAARSTGDDTTEGG